MVEIAGTWVSLEFLEALVDDDDCWYDHHGGCQAHGYLSLEGMTCPQKELKEIIQRVKDG
jgi:hypothetical protein